jgi:hypothetical protein
VAGIFIFVEAYISRGSGRELNGIADKNDIKVSYNNLSFLDEVVKRLQPVKSVKVAKKVHNGFRKAYIELTFEKTLQTSVCSGIMNSE